MQSLPESDASVSQRWSLWSSREFGTSVSLRKGVKGSFEIGEAYQSSIHTRLNGSVVFNGTEFSAYADRAGEVNTVQIQGNKHL